MVSIRIFWKLIYKKLHEWLKNSKFNNYFCLLKSHGDTPIHKEPISIIRGIIDKKLRYDISILFYWSDPCRKFRESLKWSSSKISFSYPRGFIIGFFNI